MSKQTPNQDVKDATYDLTKIQLLLDNVDVEHFDTETIRAFIATLNEVKLSAVKIRKVLEPERGQDMKNETKSNMELRRDVHDTLDALARDVDHGECFYAPKYFQEYLEKLESLKDLSVRYFESNQRELENDLRMQEGDDA